MGICVRPANRQYVAMSEEEVFEFLRQSRVIFVATVKPNGRPHVVPVWFTLIGKKLYFRTQDYKVKVKNIARNPWVACSAHAGDKYVDLRGVMIEGIARIIEDEEESRRLQQEIIARTKDLRWRAEEMPREWVEAFAASQPPLRLRGGSKPILLVGIRRIGKTSLLKVVLNE